MRQARNSALHGRCTNNQGSSSHTTTQQPAETMDTITATTAAVTALPFSVKEPLPKPATVAMPTMGGSDRAATATLQLMLQPSSCRTTSIACMRANDRRRNHAGCLTICGTANTGGNCTQENTGHTMNCRTATKHSLGKTRSGTDHAFSSGTSTSNTKRIRLSHSRSNSSTPWFKNRSSNHCGTSSNSVG